MKTSPSKAQMPMDVSAGTQCKGQTCTGLQTPGRNERHRGSERRDMPQSRSEAGTSFGGKPATLSAETCLGFGTLGWWPLRAIPSP